MLSRVAERVYWAARYLERVENTSRLVKAYSLLLLDLPPTVGLNWYNLIILNNAEKQFAERYKNREEKNILKFLLADKENPSAMRQCLRMVRENIRTTREVLPPEVWEAVNELSMYVDDHIQWGIGRTRRDDYLDTVSQACQQIHGLIDGAMRQDEAWQFFVMGCNVERADMTTRILESGATMLTNAKASTQTKMSTVVWGNILQSLSARQSYQRTIRASVNGRDAVRFMMEDAYFPRTLRFCTRVLIQCVESLPDHHGEAVSKTTTKKSTHAQALKALRDLEKTLEQHEKHDDLGESFVKYLGQVQSKIASLHGVFSANWFVWE